MDELIFSLYTKNIIKIKNTKLKNGQISPIFIDFFEIFEYKKILNNLLENLCEFINNNFDFEEITSDNELSKNICLLLNYKFNIKYKYNLKKIKENKNFLLIKDNYGTKDIQNCNTLFLIKYSTIKNVSENQKYFFDAIYILNILYQNNILTYEKYLSLFSILDYDNNN